MINNIKTSPVIKLLLWHSFSLYKILSSVQILIVLHGQCYSLRPSIVATTRDGRTSLILFISQREKMQTRTAPYFMYSTTGIDNNRVLIQELPYHLSNSYKTSIINQYIQERKSNKYE